MVNSEIAAIRAVSRLECVGIVREVLGSIQDARYTYSKGVSSFLNGLANARLGLSSVAVHYVAEHCPFALISGITAVHETSHSFLSRIVARL
jgi:hypothetical protein